MVSYLGFGVFALAIFGCKEEVPWTPPDLATRLDVTQARAGVIQSSDALWAGIAAEGQVGDVKIYNSRVRFVLQGLRPGHYYLDQSGGIIDADLVRPEGELGRDGVEEWTVMFGLGRVFDAESIEVVDDGVESGVAHVAVIGTDSPLALAASALGSQALFDSKGLSVRTDYRLASDSYFLEVKTTVSGLSPGELLLLGDGLVGSKELWSTWSPVTGLDTSTDDRPWGAYVSDDNTGVLGVFPSDEAIAPGPLGLLGDFLPILGAFSLSTKANESGELRFTRLYGVGPDLEHLTAEAASRRAEPMERYSDRVTAPDGPVAGARVNVYADGELYTFAVTDENGDFSASISSGATISYRAVGQASRAILPWSPESVPLGPYAHAAVQEKVMARLSASQPSPSASIGRGISSNETPLQLSEPGWLNVSVAGGLPFTVRAARVDGGRIPERRLERSNRLSRAWGLTGSARLPLEAGDYSVLVHRGARFELQQQTLTIVSGEEVSLNVDLPKAFSHEGWLLADPHSHAAPSNDSSISMEERLLTSAAVGLQLHFGTDHDHIVDYRPLIDALGLSGSLRSVVADEVSSLAVGHMNLYPLFEVPGESNNGAYLWWNETSDSTEEMVNQLRNRYGPTPLIQSNHPHQGLMSVSNWQPGLVGNASRWTEQLEVMEVCNDANCEGAYPFWSDLALRGYLTTPVGVSDAHNYADGHQGLSATYLAINGVDAYSDEALIRVMRAGQTVVTRGPFLKSSIMPGEVLTQPTQWQIEAKTPSWFSVDRLRLYKNGALFAEEIGAKATFTVESEADAIYWVIASGDESMAPVWPDQRPWAMIAPIRYDAGADGWIPPLSALEVR